MPLNLNNLKVSDSDSDSEDERPSPNTPKAEPAPQQEPAPTNDARESTTSSRPQEPSKPEPAVQPQESHPSANAEPTAASHEEEPHGAPAAEDSNEPLITAVGNDSNATSPQRTDAGEELPTEVSTTDPSPQRASQDQNGEVEQGQPTDAAETSQHDPLAETRGPVDDAPEAVPPASVDPSVDPEFANSSLPTSDGSGERPAIPRIPIAASQPQPQPAGFRQPQERRGFSTGQRHADPLGQPPRSPRSPNASFGAPSAISLPMPMAAVSMQGNTSRARSQRSSLNGSRAQTPRSNAGSHRSEWGDSQSGAEWKQPRQDREWVSTVEEDPTRVAQELMNAVEPGRVLFQPKISSSNHTQVTNSKPVHDRLHVSKEQHDRKRVKQERAEQVAHRRESRPFNNMPDDRANYEEHKRRTEYLSNKAAERRRNLSLKRKKQSQETEDERIRAELRSEVKERRQREGGSIFEKLSKRPTKAMQAYQHARNNSPSTITRSTPRFIKESITREQKEEPPTVVLPRAAINEAVDRLTRPREESKAVTDEKVRREERLKEYGKPELSKKSSELMRKREDSIVGHSVTATAVERLYWRARVRQPTYHNTLATELPDFVDRSRDEEVGEDEMSYYDSIARERMAAEEVE